MRILVAAWRVGGP